MKQEELNNILNGHKKWLNGEGGARADLSGAYLRSANLSNISANENTAMYWSVCPESGSFIAYKKANNGRQHLIVKLLVPEDAKRSSATTRKCRCDRAEVLEIRDIAGIECFDKAISSHDPTFIYEVGKTVIVDNFDEDRWNECSYGIHFFITREEAVRY